MVKRLYPSLRCKVIKKVQSYHIFITGGAGVGQISFDKSNFFVFE